MGNGFAIVSVSRTVRLEKHIEPPDPIGHCIHRLQPDRDTIIGEGKFDMMKPGLAAKIALIHPHPIEHAQASRLLRPRPDFFGKELGHP